MKKAISLILALMLCVSLAAPALADIGVPPLYDGDEFTLTEDGEYSASRGFYVETPGWYEFYVSPVPETANTFSIFRRLDSDGLTYEFSNAGIECFQSRDYAKYCVLLEDYTVYSLFVSPGYSYTFTVAYRGIGWTPTEEYQSLSDGGYYDDGGEWAEYVAQFTAYAVEGGNIYFKEESGEVVIADIEVTGADIPASINGVAVSSIADYAFSNCWNLYSVIIPETVAYIGWSAFENTGLREITIPAGVEEIGSSAFSSCSSLAAIHVAAGNTNYCDVDGVLFSYDRAELYAFPGARIGAYAVPDGVSEIWGGAFSGCALAEVAIPASVSYIGDSAFYYCENLTAIHVAAGNTNYCDVDGVLFSGDKTELIVCPSGKTGAFEIPFGTKVVDSSAFAGCTGLASVTIPDSVTEIWDNAFMECGLTRLTIPGSVTELGPNSFILCTELKELTISDGVETIDWGAFGGCWELSAVTIPASVTVIEEGAFSGCDVLSDVYFAGSEAQWAAIEIRVENECLSLAVIHYNSTGRAVVPSEQSFMLNGVSVGSLPAYNIDGYNYFKIRDLAALLSGTGSQFEVKYIPETNMINVVPGESYTTVGGELEKGENLSATCEVSAQTIHFNGKPVQLKGYNIGGYNYFMLRDEQLQALLGYTVGYDWENNIGTITTG